MNLGIAGDLDMKKVASLLAYKRHQFVGIAMLSGGSRARGNISPQGDQPSNPGLPVNIQQLHDLAFVGAAEGKMRRHL